MQKAHPMLLRTLAILLAFTFTIPACVTDAPTGDDGTEHPGPASDIDSDTAPGLGDTDDDDTIVCAAYKTVPCNAGEIEVCVPAHGCGYAECNGHTYEICDSSPLTEVAQ